jgi:hypothetical protein
VNWVFEAVDGVGEAEGLATGDGDVVAVFDGQIEGEAAVAAAVKASARLLYSLAGALRSIRVSRRCLVGSGGPSG